MTTRACPRCDHIHAARDAIAVDRFDPDRPTTYRAPDGRTYATRSDAEAAYCATRAKETP